MREPRQQVLLSARGPPIRMVPEMPPTGRGHGVGPSTAGLRVDVVAGLTAAAVVLPKALAYATVAGPRGLHGIRADASRSSTHGPSSNITLQASTTTNRPLRLEPGRLWPQAPGPLYFSAHRRWRQGSTAPSVSRYRELRYFRFRESTIHRPVAHLASILS